MRDGDPAQAAFATATEQERELRDRVTAAVCVPVRNEERTLPHLLIALAALELAGVDLFACFLLDSCTDASASILRAGALPFAMLVKEGRPNADANAGRARAAAMAMGVRAVGGRANAVLLSTDADSRPRGDWVQATIAALRIGDVAAGRLLRIGGQGDMLQGRVERYYDRLHAHRRAVDPVAWDTTAGCHHGGAANLAILVGAYRALGGFRPLPAGEDAQLLDDAARAGLRVRRDPAMVVETSSRRIGRAAGGLAASLRALDMGGLPRVEHPAAAAWQWRRHADARAAFADMDDSATRDWLGKRIGLSGDHVLGVARDCSNAEAFAMRIVPAAPDAGRLVSLPEAERALAEMDGALCRGAA